MEKFKFKRVFDTKSDDQEQTTDNSTSPKGYEYLLKIPVYALSLEEVDKLQKDIHKIQSMVEALKKKTKKTLWLDDLMELKDKYDVEMKKWYKEFDSSSVSKKTKTKTKK